MSDQPQIQFFEFKARKFCTWFDKTAQSVDYDGVQAIQVVSGLVAPAASPGAWRRFKANSSGV